MRTNIHFNSILFLSVLWSAICFGQEEDRQLTPKEDLVVDAHIGWFIPTAYGSNFLNKSYDLKTGFQLHAIGHLPNKWLIGGQVSSFKGNVVNISAIGNITSTIITHWNLLGGYNLIKKRILINAGIGIGYVSYKNEIADVKFRDDGFSLLQFADISLPISEMLGVFVNLQNYMDFPSINTAPQQKDFFNSSGIFSVSVGLKFYFY